MNSSIERPPVRAGASHATCMDSDVASVSVGGAEADGAEADGPEADGPEAGGAPADADWLAEQLKEAGLATEVRHGEAALAEVARAPEAEVVMAAIVGAAGLLPTLAAVRAGKRVLLANKEALVMSGALFMKAVEQSGASLLPIE